MVRVKYHDPTHEQNRERKDIKKYNIDDRFSCYENCVCLHSASVNVIKVSSEHDKQRSNCCRVYACFDSKQI